MAYKKRYQDPNKKHWMDLAGIERSRDLSELNTKNKFTDPEAFLALVNEYFKLADIPTKIALANYLGCSTKTLNSLKDRIIDKEKWTFIYDVIHDTCQAYFETVIADPNSRNVNGCLSSLRRYYKGWEDKKTLTLENGDKKEEFDISSLSALELLEYEKKLLEIEALTKKNKFTKRLGKPRPEEAEYREIEPLKSKDKPIGINLLDDE